MSQILSGRPVSQRLRLSRVLSFLLPSNHGLRQLNTGTQQATGPPNLSHLTLDNQYHGEPLQWRSCQPVSIESPSIMMSFGGRLFGFFPGYPSSAPVEFSLVSWARGV